MVPTTPATDPCREDLGAPAELAPIAGVPGQLMLPLDGFGPAA